MAPAPAGRWSLAARAAACVALARAAGQGRSPGGKEGEVTIGDVRVQALSPGLVRVEPRGPKGFEDRPTFMVVNRTFPGVSAVLKDSADGKVVRTEHYDVVLRGSDPPACGEVLHDTDVETDPGGSRSSKFPDGTLVPDGDACCAACAGDPTCNAWVYTVDLGQCYTLTTFLSVKKGRKNRVFGVRPPRLSFEVRDPSGAVLYDSLKDHGKARHLLTWPAPLTATSYALVDHPRFHKPEWGHTPVPPEAEVDEDLQSTNGYDFDNGVEGDTYVFLLGDDLEGWTASRAEFAALTGPVPVLPDYAYGTWFTWWHPYDEAEAREDVERWDSDDLPLDVWGLDMNWRHVSDDKDRFYDQPNTDLFSDFEAFFAYLRGKGLRTFFNDHPFPVAGRGAGGLQTSPEEVSFRWKGLTQWMAQGLDFWWFDVNWGISIPPPTVNQSGTAGNWLGLGNAAWGSHVYFTIVDRFHRMLGSRGTDDSRGITLTKFARDDARPGSGPKGSNRPPESPAQHRYPVWWTGDNVNLQASVESMVDAGVHDFKPFVHSDCGGDTRESAGDLLRWTAHCAFGTILRYHGADHRPWTFDGETEDVVRSYLRARYKLLPTLIAAGREATESGFPLAARGDLLWPGEEGSSRSDQYVFLRDLLVAPITDSDSNVTSRTVWIPPGEWQDVWSGRVHEGPQELKASQPFQRLPMYYRRDGGVLVISQENVTRTADQKWGSLTVEVFPSTASLTTRRVIYERHTNARTDIELSTDGSGLVQLLLSQPEEAAGRTWVVRVHLRQGQSVESAAVDGTAADARLIAPHATDPGVLGFFPLGDEDDPPAPLAGPLAIVQLDGGGPLARRLEVRLQSGSAGSVEGVTAMYSLRQAEEARPRPLAVALAGLLALPAAVAAAAVAGQRAARRGPPAPPLEDGDSLLQPRAL